MNLTNCSPSNACEIARERVKASIEPAKGFPSNVFRGPWRAFYFFDSDWMTNPEFVGHALGFLEVDGGRCACLWKLDSDATSSTSFTCISAQTVLDDYRLFLAGPKPGFGWLDTLPRVACAPDAGDWCMYCEADCEIAVVAFLDDDVARRYTTAMARVKAERFDDAIGDPPLSYGFSQRALTPEWRRVMSLEYATKRS